MENLEERVGKKSGIEVEGVLGKKAWKEGVLGLSGCRTSRGLGREEEMEDIMSLTFSGTSFSTFFSQKLKSGLDCTWCLLRYQPSILQQKPLIKSPIENGMFQA